MRRGEPLTLAEYRIRMLEREVIRLQRLIAQLRERLEKK